MTARLIAIMQSRVGRAGQNFQVFGAVIRFIAVAMMDHFVSLERSSQHLFGHSAMFGVIRTDAMVSDAPIAILARVRYATFPVRIASALILGGKGMLCTGCRTKDVMLFTHS